MFINDKESPDVALIEKNLASVTMPTEEEIERILAENYADAHAAEIAEYGIMPMPESAMLFHPEGILPGMGKKLWKKLKRLVCAVLNNDSVMSEIIKAVIDALEKILPGGRIIGWLIEKVVKYILGSGGIGRFCAV